jgi:vacuolar protein-sorting-associated protein 4
MTWDDIEAEQLLEPLVDFKDFVKAIEGSGTSVSQVDLEKNAQWTSEFGSEGN